MKVKLCISIDKKIAESLKTFCEENGYKISNLIELAIKEKMGNSKRKINMKYYRIDFSDGGFENGYFDSYEDVIKYAEEIKEMTKEDFNIDCYYTISEYDSEEDYYNNI